jgi:hypothetical protein
MIEWKEFRKRRFETLPCCTGGAKKLQLGRLQKKEISQCVPI